jgi:hypothetical protein
MRRLAFAAAALLLTGCAPVGPTVVTEPVEAPDLVLDVTNATPQEVVIGWEFEADGHSGSGEALIAACRRESMVPSVINGGYTISVNGETVAEGTVPERAGAETFLVVRVRIGPDGDVDVDPPGVALQPPPAVGANLPGCG